MRPCQTGHKCVWGRKHDDLVVCGLPRCALVKKPLSKEQYQDRLLRRTVVIKT